MLISHSIHTQISQANNTRKYRIEIGKTLRRICERMDGLEIIEANACEDHIHTLVTIPPQMSVAGFMGYLKGKSSLIIHQKWGNMKFVYRNRKFWYKEYYVDIIGKDTVVIKEYIVNQLKQDK